MRFELQIHHEDADLLDYQRAAAASHPDAQAGPHILNAILAATSALAAMVCVAELRGDRLDIGLAFTAASLTLICFYVVALIGAARRSRAFLRRYALDRRAHTASIDEGGVVLRWNTGEMREGWPGVEDVTLTERLVVLWIDELSGVALPRRAIGDKGEIQRFLGFVRPRLKTGTAVS